MGLEERSGKNLNNLLNLAVPTCLRLQAPIGGSLHPAKHVYHVNDVVSFTCGPGFELIGRPELICIPGGWIDYPPTCKGTEKFVFDFHDSEYLETSLKK